MAAPVVATAVAAAYDYAGVRFVVAADDALALAHAFEQLGLEFDSQKTRRVEISHAEDGLVLIPSFAVRRPVTEVMRKPR